MSLAFAVSINGHELVTVSTEGLDLLEMRVHGVRANAEFAELDVSGGCYGEGRESKHFLWEADRPVNPGDDVSLVLVEGAQNSRPGKTIDEIYGHEPTLEGPPLSIDQALKRRATDPLLRGGYTFLLRTPVGEEIAARTLPDEWDFSYSVRWAWVKPQWATVNLSSSSLPRSSSDFEAGTVRRSSHARFYISVGERVTLRVN